MASPKVMNFWKSSKRPLIPPPHFRKIMLRFFPEYMTKEAFIMVKICNINFWIGNAPPPPFGTFPKIHHFWRRHPSLTLDPSGVINASIYPPVKTGCKNTATPQPTSARIILLLITISDYWLVANEASCITTCLAQLSSLGLTCFASMRTLLFVILIHS